ncbi:hypothetical protein HJA83_00395 [Rhizobium bangladeshense]|uniref:hypothetical protein n=1 Tax=Rhizobium bangladeshense TaxID=1138189 RepID=UPI001C8314B1|nr:hypothetical protein [Rhizobium bangladeshense]MBX4899823.1 hypothetical protein [Rhizobium bangladeshense]
MPFDVSELRALFPSLFSRREPFPGEPPQWPDRDWETLAIGRTAGRLRIVGPNWSFACLLSGQGGGRVVALDALAQSDEPTDPAIKGLRRPTSMRARISDFWRGTEAAQSPSRYSIVAIDTNKGAFPSLPLPQSASPSGYAFDKERTSELVIETIGVIPRNRALATTNVDLIYLPATRLVAGEIWFRPVSGYLDKVRAALELGPPDGKLIPTDAADKMVLLPDGFVVSGSIALPWRANPLTAWFLVSMPEKKNCTQALMQLWRAPAVEWQGALDELEGILAASSRGKGSPHWLRLRAGYNIAPEALSWPVGRTSEILLRRDLADAASRAVHIRSDSLVATLGTASDSGSILTLRPAEFRVVATGSSQVAITSVSEDAEPSSDADLKADATYLFDAAAEEREKLTLDQGGKPLRLAVPLLSNAERLRREMGFDVPRFELKDWTSTETNWLWLFTALEGGWLHWPFPNATVSLLGAVTAGHETVDDPIAGGRRASSGAWRLAGSAAERPWSIVISGTEYAELETVFRRDAEGWVLAHAKVVSRGMSLRFDGILPVTPYLQTTERLLPDAAERALRHASLDAVTPDLLRGVEWDAWNVPAAEALRVTATIANLVVQPPGQGAGVQFGPTSYLKVETSWPSAGIPSPSENSKRKSSGETRPWLWLRHESLPSVQTMPLTAAGAAIKEPSGLRELAPLRRVANDTPFVLAFTSPFQMTRTTVGFKPTDTGIFERPSTRAARPSQKSDQATHTADRHVIDDLGMAITTMPSLSIFAGQPHPRSFALKDKVWNGATLAAAIEAELRYDIALCDERFALAAVPPPPNQDIQVEDITPREVGAMFTPLPYNAPDSEASSAWSDVWTARIRSQALATAADVRMVERRDTGHVLQSVFYGLALPLSAVQFDPTILIREPDAEGDSAGQASTRRLSHAGRLKLIPEPKGGTAQDMRGLPSNEDLNGLQGEFSRGDRTEQIVRGTLAAEADGTGRFLDQGSIITEPPTLTSQLMRRSIDSKSELVTLVEAIPVDRGSNLTALFHFRDVAVPLSGPESDLSDAWYDDDLAETGLDRAANSAQIDRNHRAGFVWALSDDNERTGDHVSFGPFLFEPLALRRVKLTSDRKDLAGAVVAGHLKIQVGGRLVAVGGPVELALAHKDKKLTWRISSRADLTIPLDNPDLRGRHNPLLILSGFALDANSVVAATSKLRFTAGGRSIERPLDVQKKSAGGLEFKDKDNKTDAGFAGSHVHLFDDGASPVASARLFLTLGPPHACLRLAESITVAGKAADYSASTYTFGNATLSVDAEINFDQRILAVAWETPRAQPFIGGLLVDKGSNGTVIAVLAKDSFELSAPVRAASRLLLTFPTSPLLALAMTYDATAPNGIGEARLSGKIAVSNDFQWPVPILHCPTDNHEIVRGDVGSCTERFKHDLDITFDAAPVALAQLAAEDMHVAARVKHTVTLPDHGSKEWSVYQPVRISSPKAAMARLKDLQTSGQIAVLSGSRSTGDANIAKIGETMTSALSVDLAKAMQTSLAASPASVLLDASAHHFVVVTDGATEKFIHLPLPVLAAIGAGGWFTVTAPGALLVRKIDLAIHSGLPALRRDQKVQMLSRLENATSAATLRGSDIASELIDTRAKERHEPTFTGATALVGDENTPLDQKYSWADQSMRLGLFFARIAEPTELNGSGLTLHTYGWHDGELVSEELVEGGVPIYKADSYKTVWSEKFLGEGLGRFVPGPEGIPIAAPLPLWNISIIAPSASGVSLATVAAITVEGTSPPDIKRWASSALARCAPSATVGLVVLRELKAGITLIRESFLVESGSPRFDRPDTVVSVRSQSRAHQGQKRKRAVSGPSPSGFLAGYLPALTGADVVMDSPAADGEAGGAIAALTASSGVAGFNLAASGQRVMEPQNIQFWISDREVEPFRAFEPVPEKKPSPVTFALPEATTAGLPSVLLPGRSSKFVAPAEPAQDARGYLPPMQHISAVGVRAGIWMARRLGIEAYESGAKAGHSAMEIPLWLRTPRPAELGADDRTRSSEYEKDRHMSLCPSPVAILHGPAKSVAPFEVNEHVPGRPPLSTDAMIVEIIEPRNGLLRPDWDGRIVLTVTAAFDSPTKPSWSIEKATLKIGSAVYRPKMVTGTIGPDEPATLADFQASNQRASEALMNVSPGTVVSLGLLVVRDGLARRLRFDLRAGGNGALLEHPAFVRFNDPAYDDQLTRIPKSDARPIPGTGFDLVLVVERGEVGSADFVEAGLALRRNSETTAVPTSAWFILQGGIFLVIEREAAGKKVEERIPITLAIARMRLGDRKELVGTYKPRLSGGGLPFVNIAQDLAEVADDLQERDQIVITADLAVAHLNCSLFVTERPEITPNPSAYAFLRLDEARQSSSTKTISDDGNEPTQSTIGSVDAKLSVPLFARGAMPTLLELVDPREMVYGLVRCRANYVWQTMLPTASESMFALQKISGVGATWLPADLEREWQSVRGPS